MKFLRSQIEIPPAEARTRRQNHAGSTRGVARRPSNHPGSARRVPRRPVNHPESTLEPASSRSRPRRITPRRSFRMVRITPEGPSPLPRRGLVPSKRFQPPMLIFPVEARPSQADPATTNPPAPSSPSPWRREIIPASSHRRPGRLGHRRRKRRRFPPRAVRRNNRRARAQRQGSRRASSRHGRPSRAGKAGKGKDPHRDGKCVISPLWARSKKKSGSRTILTT